MVAVVAFLFMSALTVFLLELCLRLLNPFFPEPQRSIVQEAIRITHSNRRSYNGRIALPEKAKADVLVIGDSFVFGILVKEKSIFPNVLGQLLGEKVTSLGVTAQSPPQYNRLLEVGARYEPKEVVYCVFANDFLDYAPYACRISTDSCYSERTGDDRLFLREATSNDQIYQVQKWFGNLFATLQICKLFQQPKATGSKAIWQQGGNYIQFPEKPYWELLRYDRPETRAGMEEMLKMVECARQFSNGLGAVFRVVLIPSKEMAYADIVDGAMRERIFDLSYLETYRVFRERLVGAGIPCLDTTPAIVEKARSGQPPYFSIDGHFNELGHEVTARAISDFLKRERAAAGRPPE